MDFDSYTKDKLIDSLDNVEMVFDSLLEENIIEQVYGDDIRRATRELDNVRDEVQGAPDAEWDKIQDFIFNIESNVDDMKEEIKDISRDLGL